MTQGLLTAGPTSWGLWCRRGALAGLIIFTGATSRSDAVEIIGHRGASHDAPENTLASIRLAFEQGADAAEIDVYLSRDGEIVTIHDKDTKRVGGRDRPVVEQTLAELRQLDVGRWKSPKYAGECIPTLSEVLALIPAGKRLFIEVKCGPEIVPKLAQVLKESGKKPEQTCIISFSHDVVARAKRELPELKCYWIVQMKEPKDEGRWRPSPEQVLKRAREAGVDGVDFGAAPIIDGDFVARFQKAHLEIYIWTVDAPDEARRLVRAGVAGITTNRPGFLRERLGDLKAAAGEAEQKRAEKTLGSRP
jgi:glycerophosphoryl diester phosphodiesterase